MLKFSFLLFSLVACQDNYQYRQQYQEYRQDPYVQPYDPYLQRNEYNKYQSPPYQPQYQPQYQSPPYQPQQYPPQQPPYQPPNQPPYQPPNQPPNQPPQQTQPTPPSQPTNQPPPNQPPNQQPPPNNRPAECIPIESTSACAPWNKGYYINATELAMVYGLEDGKRMDASNWGSLVTKATSGGDFQAEIWKDWSQCSGYKGELIQYSRSYVCLTDIFLFSAGCNPTPPSPPKLCGDVCDAYGNALNQLLDNKNTCPSASGNKEVEARRNALKNAARGCRDILGKWSNDGKCSAGTIFGVENDSSSCGFSGNQETAKQFCKDFSNAPCCSKLSPVAVQSKQASSLTSSLGDSADASAASSSPSSGGGLSTGAIVGVSLMSVLVVGGLVAGLVMRKRKKTYGIVTKTGGIVAGKSSPVSPNSREVSTVTTSYQADMNDEVTLRIGDVVDVYERFTDGWGKGKNISTGQVGVFPLACLQY